MLKCAVGGVITTGPEFKLPGLRFFFFVICTTSVSQAGQPQTTGCASPSAASLAGSYSRKPGNTVDATVDDSPHNRRVSSQPSNSCAPISQGFTANYNRTKCETRI